MNASSHYSTSFTSFTEKDSPPKKTKSGTKGQTQEPLYADPYEEDPAYRAPTVPAHLSTHEVRTSYALVEVDDNAFDDSFEDDDDEEDDNEQSNLEPLAEGASNPLDLLGDETVDSPAGASNPLDILRDETVDSPAQSSNPPAPQQVKQEVAPAKEWENLDFGFGPGNLGPSATAAPPAAPPTAPPAASPAPPPPAPPPPPPPPPVTGGSTQPPPSSDNQANLMDFSFDFGGNVPPLPANDDFFSSAAGAGDLANLDLGTLDANFFDKLEAMEVTDQSNSAKLNQQGFDQFWTDMDTSLPKM